MLALRVLGAARATCGTKVCPLAARGIFSASALRLSSSEPVEASNLRKGMVFLHEGKYCEVTQWENNKKGRGAQSYSITYDSLETGKSHVLRFGASGKATVITPDKVTHEVLYVEGEAQKMVVLVDDEYNQVEVAYERFPAGADLGEGARCNLWKDGENIMKVQMLPKQKKAFGEA
eukprot:gnl/TRDRNA2_/TRDRNA2_185591_c0_seq1.p1 gnl/TRDRNA2_/TRDRNA2_185591_c0~~gnl/TRDRNA2_/TRDRNA2_185591_c0_seq1.p1  ORF type:complete len:176 (-),score=43.26 gnl/TRDRNA2_/TRDRNA2_185591_c0_seq1:337-864(-)